MELQLDKKYLIDTNILIYSINEDSEFNDAAKKLLIKFQRGLYKGFISTQNILEFKRVMTNPVFKNISYEYIDEVLNVWLQFLTIIYEDKSTWLEFQRLDRRLHSKGNIIFDTWLASTMIAHNIENILTMNVKDFKEIQEVNAINPLAL